MRGPKTLHQLRPCLAHCGHWNAPFPELADGEKFNEGMKSEVAIRAFSLRDEFTRWVMSPFIVQSAADP